MKTSNNGIIINNKTIIFMNPVYGGSLIPFLHWLYLDWLHSARFVSVSITVFSVLVPTFLVPAAEQVRGEASAVSSRVMVSAQRTDVFNRGLTTAELLPEIPESQRTAFLQACLL
ncbi:hypothetical protein CHARACLAT_030650 [Characodon lateralis]|uniref:Uncharacterized protein n=1 Tax=Characodon lateralis TaxID=208331 RepID=A0ABU7ERD1_9TELE|nr:hypothetical protein [Characodon lateralis]